MKPDPPAEIQTTYSGPLGVHDGVAALTETNEGVFYLTDDPQKAREIAAWFIRYAEWLEGSGTERTIIRDVPIFRAGDWNGKTYTTDDIDRWCGQISDQRRDGAYCPPVLMRRSVMGLLVRAYRTGDTMYGDFQIRVGSEQRQVFLWPWLKDGKFDSIQASDNERSVFGFPAVNIPAAPNTPLGER